MFISRVFICLHCVCIYFWYRRNKTEKKTDKTINSISNGTIFYMEWILLLYKNYIHIILNFEKSFELFNCHWIKNLCVNDFVRTADEYRKNKKKTNWKINIEDSKIVLWLETSHLLCRKFIQSVNNCKRKSVSISLCTVFAL